MTPIPVPTRTRVESVDILRGIIMVLMALDHTRDYFGNLAVNPTDPATTTVALFFTRWTTHICAPGFFLLTGVGAALTTRRMSKRELSRFLFTRGFWLIFLELVIIRSLGWQFNFNYRLTLLEVIWALGWAMISLSLLIRLPVWAVTAVGALLIGTHNLLDGVQATSFGALAPLWNILHVPGFIVNDPGRVVFVAYPLIPWIGVTAAGYGLGQVYQWEAERRRSFLLRLGLGCLALFLALRAVNIYGDPRPWATQASPIFTLLSFLNTSKYPPSLLFLLMTFGPLLLVLRALDAGSPKWLRPTLVFGKVPLFYFMLHVVLIHLLAVVVCLARYGQVYWMFQSNSMDQFPITQPPGWPLSLPWIYLIWIAVVLALYPLCRWYAGLRQRQKNWWLSYL